MIVGSVCEINTEWPWEEISKRLEKEMEYLKEDYEWLGNKNRYLDLEKNYDD